MSGQGFRADSNGFQPTAFIPRPTASHAAFADLSPEALSIAQEHWDEANTARLTSEARAKQIAEYEASDEAADARKAQSSLYSSF
jgi:hypothetical protein